MKPNVYAILNELKQNVEYISEAQMDALAQKIDHANHIFLTGKGRRIFCKYDWRNLCTSYA